MGGGACAAVHNTFCNAVHLINNILKTGEVCPLPRIHPQGFCQTDLGRNLKTVRIIPRNSPVILLIVQAGSRQWQHISKVAVIWYFHTMEVVQNMRRTYKCTLLHNSPVVCLLLSLGKHRNLHNHLSLQKVANLRYKKNYLKYIIQVRSECHVSPNIPWSTNRFNKNILHSTLYNWDQNASNCTNIWIFEHLCLVSNYLGGHIVPRFTLTTWHQIRYFFFVRALFS